MLCTTQASSLLDTRSSGAQHHKIRHNALLKRLSLPQAQRQGGMHASPACAAPGRRTLWRCTGCAARNVLGNRFRKVCSTRSCAAPGAQVC